MFTLLLSYISASKNVRVDNGVIFVKRRSKPFLMIHHPLCFAIFIFKQSSDQSICCNIILPTVLDLPIRFQHKTINSHPNIIKCHVKYLVEFGTLTKKLHILTNLQNDSGDFPSVIDITPRDFLSATLFLYPWINASIQLSIV